MDPSYRFRTATVDEVVELRQAVLDRGESGGGIDRRIDEPPDAHHLVAIRNDRVVAVGSIRPEERPEAPALGAWRAHGLAVDYGHRGRGIGARLLERLLRHAAEQGAASVWCRAPAGSLGFFERQGFFVSGDPIGSDAGPEYLLVRDSAKG